MSRSARRREQRASAAELKAAGVYVPRRPRSHFRTADIAAAVRDDIAAARLRMLPRVATDPQWAWDPALAGANPVHLLQLRDPQVNHAPE